MATIKRIILLALTALMMVGCDYTRKDVFIEKASRWIEENICEYCEGENIIFTANNTQYIDILNQQQFIEDFVNYMKGE